MNKIIRMSVIFFVCAAAIVAMAGTVKADPFIDAATNPSFMRDLHIVSAGGYRIESANTDNGQRTGVANTFFFGGSDIWNDEHNEVLAGLQYGRREFAQELTLPDGFVIPKQLDNVTAGVVYKHITSGDWSISQGIRYTRAWTDMQSVTVRDTFDLVGLVAVSHQPGIMWAFGYIVDQKDYLRPVYLPVIEYVNASHAKWTLTAGYPVVNFSYAPHPDWMIGGGAIISYKVSDMNRVSLSFSSDNWAYRLAGPDVKTIAYAAQVVGFSWKSVFAITRRTAAVLNASIGWEFNRKLGTSDEQSIGDAAIMELNASLSF